MVKTAKIIELECPTSEFIIFKMAAMPFPCNDLLLWCVNLPYCFSMNLLVVLKVFFLGFKDDLIYLFQNKFLFRIFYLSTLVILLCYT